MPNKDREEMQQYINEAVALTMSKALEYIYPSGTINYFSAMERLLFAYKNLKALVNSPEEYMASVSVSRSKDVVRYSASNGGRRDPADVQEERIQDRTMSYSRTESDFEQLDRVIEQFRKEPEFSVIGMYYLHEDELGMDRDPGARKYTWNDIALELDKDERTVRRWRSRLVKEMAVCMFGTAAAVSFGVHQQGLTDARIAPGSRP